MLKSIFSSINKSIKEVVDSAEKKYFSKKSDLEINLEHEILKMENQLYKTGLNTLRKVVEECDNEKYTLENYKEKTKQLLVAIDKILNIFSKNNENKNE